MEIWTMLKRSISAIRQWLSSNIKQTRQKEQALQNKNSPTARRSFFKKAVVGLGSVTATTGLSKVIVDSVAKTERQEHYAKTATAGEGELINREYVLMSDQEKEDMLQTFVENYKEQS